MAINFEFLFSFSRKIDLGSSILMKAKTQTQIKELVSLIFKKANQKLKSFFRNQILIFMSILVT